MRIIFICIFFQFFIANSDAQESLNFQKALSALKIKDKALKKELKQLRLIPEQDFRMNSYEGGDSVSFYFPERIQTSPFFISPFEVSNLEYKEFVNYVRDSIVRDILGYTYINNGKKYIDWKPKIDWEDKNIWKKIEPIAVSYDDRIVGEPALDVKKIIYQTSTLLNKTTIPIYPDTMCWVRQKYPFYGEPLAYGYFKTKEFNNYPVVGINYHQAMAFCDWKTQKLLNELPADYQFDIQFTLPTATEWEAAAIVPESKELKWRYDNKKNEKGTKWKKEKENLFLEDPTSFPENRTIIFKDNKYEIDCNSYGSKDENGYMIQSPATDGGLWTTPIDKYPPNANKLYDMKGNVSEWTLDDGDIAVKKTITLIKEHEKKDPRSGSLNDFISDHPNALFSKMPLDSFVVRMSKYKVVKGGGWNSTPFYLQRGVNQFYTPDANESFIGFRYVVHVKKKE